MFDGCETGLAPTPYAVTLREHVRSLAHEVLTGLGPARAGLDVAALDRLFTIGE